MQKELQFTLSIIGILIIGGVLLHGMWTIRKSSNKQKKARLESRNWEPGFEQEDGISGEAPIYDDIGLGKARVMINSVNDGDGLESYALKDEALSINDEVIESPSVDDSTITEAFESPSVDDSTITEAIESPSVDDSSDTDAIESSTTTGSSLTEDFDVVNSSHLAPNNAKDVDIIDQLAVHKQDDLGVEVDELLIASDLKFDSGIVPKDELFSNNEDQDDVNNIGTEEIKDQSETLVYSNVVTQPKPEFSRPNQTNVHVDSSFGQPPEFLLKKTVSKNEDGAQEVSVQDNQPAQPQKIETPTIAETNPPSSDFSLNIQEGPKLKSNTQGDTSTTSMEEKELSFTEQAKRFVRRNKKTVGEKIRKDPVLKDKAATDQMRIDFDETEGANKQETEAKANSGEAKPTQSSSTSSDKGETDVLVLNVRASDDNPIQGASLLPMLLTLGFKFGEHDIFHRHVNTNGKGPILFSLTNMFKPGVFDIDNIENFSTYGLSLFMMLPIEGDAQQVFNMMHNAARKLSEEFSGRILDGNKVGLSKQSLQQYFERIREFERKRINK